VALAVGVVTVGALYHLAMVFLHVAPSNTLSRGHATAISEYIYPEFEQNWKLFAPNPLQQNIHVEARAETLLPGGAKKTTGWVDMTGQDIDAMRHDPAPSHSEQNELRRAWSFYSDTHDTTEQPNGGDRSDMSRTYLQRILEKRFGTEIDGGRVVRIQARVATTQVPQPSWSGGQSGASTAQYRELPWWIANTTSSGQENAS
jgi:hypothetical protein